MTLPSVAIVIANHDYGRFLGAAIDSALAQTHPLVSVVVVDDGSTDDSRDVLASYGDRVRTVLTDNHGQASALNTGFDTTDSDVVIFLDADDVLHRETAARVAATIAAAPDLAKVQYRLEVIDAAGRPTGAIKPVAHLPMPSGDVRRRELDSPFELVWLSTSGVAFPRRILERLMPIPEHEFARCPDWYLQHLAALLGPVESLDWIGGGYRVHGANQYEPARAHLDVEHVRQSIVFADVTKHGLERLARELGLDPRGEILSVADVANRMVSRRLDPDRHPLAGDHRARLWLAGCRAARRRTDVAPLMRALFVAWFSAMAVAPRPAARILGERFLFPERRGAANALLGRLHRDGMATG
jgi:glycosyltransferase involved in cell wall biosynthesis